MPPPLVIADEPTTALDVTIQAQVLDLIRELQDELRLALLLITHDFGVVAEMADRVAVMRAGRIVEEGPVRQILRTPSHDTRESARRRSWHARRRRSDPLMPLLEVAGSRSTSSEARSLPSAVDRQGRRRCELLH